MPATQPLSPPAKATGAPNCRLKIDATLPKNALLLQQADGSERQLTIVRQAIIVNNICLWRK
jgi:hypothetical protein